MADLDDPQAVIARCLKGDDVAKAEFLNRYSTAIQRGVATTLAQNSPHLPLRQDVEDIANDILVRLLANDCALMAQVRDRQRIGGWLSVLTRNHTLDYVRRYASRMRAYSGVMREEPAPYPSPAEDMIQNEDAQYAQDLLASLPARDRLALSLFYLQGMKYTEIASITSQNINTVATQIRRARERLRERNESQSPLKEVPHAAT